MEGSGSENFVTGVSPEEREGLKWRQHYERFKTTFYSNNLEKDFISFLAADLLNPGGHQ